MDTPNKTFSPVLTVHPARDIINQKRRWLSCPLCGRGKVLKLLPTTSATDLIVYCRNCKRESIVNIDPVPAP